MRVSSFPAPLRTLLAFLLENARWLAAGFVLALGSSFGQTFFIAIFAEPLRVEFALSHGQWGGIYMLGTLASALLLMRVGAFADGASPRRLAVAVALGLATVAALTAVVSSVWLLPLLVFGLRFFGQGMMSHLSATLTAKWFVATRGRALAATSLGYPVGEALLPLAAVAAIAALGWRSAWLLVAATLALGVAPLLAAVQRRDRRPRAAAPERVAGAGLEGRDWTRAEALRSRAFWLLAPGLIAPSYILTVVFFLPAHIAETKGWPLAEWVAGYAVYALVSVGAGLAMGWAIDRYSARALAPLYPAPLALGLLTLSQSEASAAVVPIMALFGASAGAAATVNAAIWAELFGVRHLGAIKAVGHALMVFGSAVGPGAAGALLDLGVSFQAQCFGMAAYAVAIGALWAGRRRDFGLAPRPTRP